MVKNLRITTECPINQEKDNFKTVIIDKASYNKLNDEFDPTRDLISYSAKYDENKDILLKIKVQKYMRNAFESDSSIVVLLDFIRDSGSYVLPFHIRGATDHWWEVAYSIKNEKLLMQNSEDTPHLKDQKIIELLQINEKDSEIKLKIDLKKLKQFGWSENFPLYVQILTHKGEIITDSFNDPKPYENANFLVGAMPINKFLKYNSKCQEIHPH